MTRSNFSLYYLKLTPGSKVVLQTLIMMMIGQFANAQSRCMCCGRALLGDSDISGTCNDAWACCIRQVHITEDA